MMGPMPFKQAANPAELANYASAFEGLRKAVFRSTLATDIVHFVHTGQTTAGLKNYLSGNTIYDRPGPLLSALIFNDDGNGFAPGFVEFLQGHTQATKETGTKGFVYFPPPRIGLRLL